MLRARSRLRGCCSAPLRGTRSSRVLYAVMLSRSARVLALSSLSLSLSSALVHRCCGATLREGNSVRFYSLGRLRVRCVCVRLRVIYGTVFEFGSWWRAARVPFPPGLLLKLERRTAWTYSKRRHSLCSYGGALTSPCLQNSERLRPEVIQRSQSVVGFGPRSAKHAIWACLLRGRSEGR